MPDKYTKRKITHTIKKKHFCLKIHFRKVVSKFDRKSMSFKVELISFSKESHVSKHELVRNENRQKFCF